MKKLMIAAITICLGTSCFGQNEYGQTEAGNWLVGGSFGFRTNKNNSSFTLLPNAAYFFADNFAAGANLTLDFSKNGNIKTNDIGFGPFVRYYLGKTPVRPFLTSSIGYISQSYKTNGTKTTTNGYNFLAGLGYAAFISDDIAIEGIAAYNYTDFKNASSYNGFSLNFGFQVYLTKSKIEQIKTGTVQ